MYGTAETKYRYAYRIKIPVHRYTAKRYAALVWRARVSHVGVTHHRVRRKQLPNVALSLATPHNYLQTSVCVVAPRSAATTAGGSRRRTLLTWQQAEKADLAVGEQRGDARLADQSQQALQQQQDEGVVGAGGAGVGDVGERRQAAGDGAADQLREQREDSGQAGGQRRQPAEHRHDGLQWRHTSG